MKGSQHIRLNFGQVIVSAGTASEMMHGSKMILADSGITKRLALLSMAEDMLTACRFLCFESSGVLYPTKRWKS